MTASLLENLLGDLDKQEFLAAFPERFFSHHGPIERLEAVKTIPELANVDAILAAYRDPVSVWLSNSASETERTYGDAMSPEEALENYNQGALLQLNEVEKWVPSLNQVMKQLERDLDLLPDTITCSLFASTTGGGVLPHYDADPAFSLQLGGEKRWWVAPQSLVQEPIDNFVVGGGRAAMAEWHEGPVPQEMPPDAVLVDMRPGSVLFIPRGYLHKTESRADSLAITFDLQIPNVADVLARYLTRTLKRDKRFRSHVLGLRSDHARVAAKIAPLIDDVASAIQAVRNNPQLAAQEMTPRLVPGPRSRYVRCPDADISIDGTTDASVTVRHPSRGATQLDVPAELTGLCRWMLGPDNTFTVMQAREFDIDLQLIDIAHLLNALIDAGALQGSPLNR